jgi:ATP-dependent DNA helicase RecG
VGCGKTAVAAAAVHLCIRAGAQAAVMAPTRLLAEQHAAAFRDLAGSLDLRPALVTGSLKGKERDRLLGEVRSGEVDLVIGTHALAQGGVVFQDLGLVVIDEQQRFGVGTRSGLAGKGESPHILVLTATPIPRTLALTAYGDLDITLIEDRPEGRLPVVTRLVEGEQKRELARFLAKRMGTGEQAIVVCPAVEAGEEGLKDVISMTAGLKRLYPGFRVGMVHGRLSEEKRLEVMERFRRGELDLLVATTVIEVGMDVPNATVMVIEHPERFGLAQLHQLRGRVGRGPVRGTCCLVRSPDLSERGLDRLRALVETPDGFRIAEQDLLMRGQGEMTGWRQAGTGELDLEDVLAHPQLLRQARQAAREILEADPALENPEHASLRRIVRGLISP